MCCCGIAIIMEITLCEKNVYHYEGSGHHGSGYVERMESKEKVS